VSRATFRSLAYLYAFKGLEEREMIVVQLFIQFLYNSNNFFFQTNHWICFLTCGHTYLMVDFLKKLLELYKNYTEIVNVSYL
jgi:hypothetical protein